MNLNPKLQIQKYCMYKSKQFLFILLITIQITQAPRGNVLGCKDEQPGDHDKCKNCQNSFKEVNWSCCITSQQNCLSCFTDTNACDSCSSDSFCFQTGSCPSCNSKIDFCSACSDCSTCISCNSTQYVISSGACVACSTLMPNCQTCSSNSTCTSCINNSSALNASNCIPCSALMDNCSNCSSPTVCTACVNSNYALNSSTCATCSDLMQNCLQCNSSTICTACVNKTFAINPTSNQCMDCSNFMPSCITCNNSTICIACQVSPNIILTNNRCASCISLIADCLNCTTTTYCTACTSTLYILDYVSATNVRCISCAEVMPSCKRCSSKNNCTQCQYGVIVANGCSSIPGCVSVIQKPITTCVACNQTYFHPNATNGSCVCLKGHLAGQYCTQIKGCTNVLRSSGNYCTICNRALHFVLENGTCICQHFYSLSDSQCTQICGDGRVMTLPCDDGNLIDGDGCSSSCQIQTGYSCKATLHSPSHCVYQGKVKLQLVCIYKSEQNSADIVLKLNPPISNIAKSNITLTFYSEKNSSKSSHKIVDGNIHLYINYLQDVQGTKSLVDIQYDPVYIQSSPFSLIVYLNQCVGNKLIYDPNASHNKSLLFQFILQILSPFILIVWLIGSYSHKMIGVETLHTFHLIFISQAFSSNYFPVVTYFKGLHNILNIYQNSITSQQTLSTIPYNRLYYSSDIAYNESVIVVIGIILLVFFLFTTFYNKLYQKIKGQQLNKQEQTKLNEFKGFLYSFLVFPLFIGFFYNQFISLFIYSQVNISKNNKNFNLEVLMILLTLITTAFIYFSEWRSIFFQTKLQTTHHKRMYIPLYLTNILILSILIQVSSIFLIQTAPIALLCVTSIYTIIIVAYKPYQHWLHNAGIVINQLGITFNLSWLLLQKITNLKKQTQEMIALSLIGWMVIILIIAIIRIVVLIMDKKCRSKMNEVQPSNRTKMKKRYESQMLNAINQQRQMNINCYLIESQIIRERQIYQYYQNKERNLQFQLINSLIANIGAEGEKKVAKSISICQQVRKIKDNQQQ